MSFSSNVWAQIKAITADELESALFKDGFLLDVAKPGSKRVYRHTDGRRVAIDYHPGKTSGPNLLKALLADIGWVEKDLRRLKLVK